jgi:hypothetical protein
MRHPVRYTRRVDDFCRQSGGSNVGETMDTRNRVLKLIAGIGLTMMLALSVAGLLAPSATLMWAQPPTREQALVRAPEQALMGTSSPQQSSAHTSERGGPDSDAEARILPSTIPALEEAINVDFYNDCGIDVHGFQFTMKDLSPSKPVNATSYPISRTFETPCPSRPCNPFTPPIANSTYGTADIKLKWMGATVPSTTSPVGHFGYTLGGVISHTMIAELIPTTATENACSCGERVVWNTTGLTGPDGGEAFVTIAMECGPPASEMFVRVSGFSSSDTYVLDELVSTNPDLTGKLKLLVDRTPLRFGQAVNATLPVNSDAVSMVLLIEWFTTRTGEEPRMRTFRSRNLVRLIPPPCYLPFVSKN